MSEPMRVRVDAVNITRPAQEVPAVPCAICGEPAPAFTRLCQAIHWKAWCDSNQSKLADEVRDKLQEAWISVALAAHVSQEPVVVCSKCKSPYVAAGAHDVSDGLCTRCTREAAR